MLNPEYQTHLKEMAVQCPQNIYVISDCTVHRTHGCVYAESAISHPLLNGVMSCSFKAPQVEEAVATIVHHYQQLQLPHSWWVETSQEPPNLKETLARKGLHPLGELYGMSLSLDGIPIPKEFTVKRISDDATLETFCQLICHAFHFSDEATHLYLHLLKKARPLTHYAGFSNSEMVTTSSLLIQDNIAYIYNTSTAEQHRKKGYATTLLSYLLQEAKSQGAHFATLTSSPDGFHVSKRVGFQEVCRFTVYA